MLAGIFFALRADLFNPTGTSFIFQYFANRTVYMHARAGFTTINV